MPLKNRFSFNQADLAKEQEIREQAKRLCLETHFNHPECEALLKLHANIIKEDALDRMQFRSLLFNALKLTNTFILDRIFRVVDTSDDGVIDGEEFTRFLSIIMRGTLEETTNFCYDVYDVNGDRSLAREELFMCLDGSIRPGRGIIDKDDVEESVKEIVELAMKKLDVNKDGQITYDDFRLAILRDPLLIQVCGPCLPSFSISRGLMFLVCQDYDNISPMINTDNKVLQSTGSSRAESSISISMHVEDHGASTPGKAQKQKKKKKKNEEKKKAKLTITTTHLDAGQQPDEKVEPSSDTKNPTKDEDDVPRMSIATTITTNVN